MDAQLVESVYSEDITRLEDLASDTILDEIRRIISLGNIFPTSLRGPFHLAVLLSPIFLLVAFQIIKKSFNRRMVLEYAAKLGPHKPPIVLEVEGLIWDGVISLSHGKIGPRQVLQNLVQDIPWSKLQMALNFYRDWFSASICKYPCI